MVIRPSATVSPGKSFERPVAGLLPRPTESETLGPAICGLTTPPGDSNGKKV